jgi:NadR type nicotinamide-nucleotide adenylyltransferase
MQTTSHTPTRGVVIGRFMPPHYGHLYLVNFARSYCDELTVLVCTLPNEPIPGSLRYSWMKELFPGVQMVHITEAVPEARKDVPGSTGIWADTIRSHVSGPISFVFASEQYGIQLASDLGATFIAVDPSRTQFPVSATDIRTSPMRYWKYIPEPVRPYFLKRVQIISESDGFAHAVAQHFETLFVPAYQIFWEKYHNRSIEPSDLSIILRAQHASEAALARQAGRVLIIATSALRIGVEARARFPDIDSRTLLLLQQAAERDHYDLTLIDPRSAGEQLETYGSLLSAMGTPFRVLPEDPATQIAAATEAVNTLIST